ncbi:MAG: glutaredoxin 3 [Oleiphilaceae bacterium]|jgi:glutaredoxin 3
MQVDVYTTQTCPYCYAAKGLLIEKGIDFHEYDVSFDHAMRKELMNKTGRRTVPQIFFNDQHIGGFTDLEQYLENQ